MYACVILCEQEGLIQIQIYYVNKQMVDAETWYTNMEKLACLGLWEIVALFSGSQEIGTNFLSSSPGAS